MASARRRVRTPDATLLRDVRTERGLTVEQLAQAAGLSKAVVSQIENGLRSSTVRERLLIGAVLGIDSTRLNVRAYLVIEERA